ncbi:MAG: type IV toxin-antitoxin system AbiEi family antitoxin [Alphaproteobacteria bacterium]|nr:type IV toxin-antitoxin system AbiEi family antitoxin [Alphaproteobacteria bacterium]
MTLENQTKINHLLKNWKYGTVCLSSWLKANGVSNQLLNSYKKSKWVESIGSGAVIRAEDKVDYLGGLHALQTQAGLSIHVGGRTALSLLGRAHYLDFAAGRTILIGSPKKTLPLWFRNRDWETRIDYYTTSFLPPDMGLTDFQQHSYSVKISGAVRAILECLFLTPKHQELFECYELMEGMTNLRPQSVQELLENCSSIKVKRLFLYLAEKFKHRWFDYIDLSKVDLGSGKRTLTKNGVYIDKYKLIVPKEFEKNEIPEI